MSSQYYSYSGAQRMRGQNSYYGPSYSVPEYGGAHATSHGDIGMRVDDVNNVQSNEVRNLTPSQHNVLLIASCRDMTTRTGSRPGVSALSTGKVIRRTRNTTRHSPLRKV